MNPDNIIDILKKMGINISRKTLYNYEQWGLISAPIFRNSRNTDYPNCVIEEAFATWRLLRGEYGNEDMKIFFAGKLPILSPAAVLAVKHFTHQEEVKESLIFLLKKRDQYGKGRYFFRYPPDEKISVKLKNEVEEIRSNAIRSAVRSSIDGGFAYEEQELQVEKNIHTALESKIQQLTTNGHKRYRSVLMVCGDTYSAILHEEEENRICKEMYGDSNNVLKNVYHEIYIGEIEIARELLKTL